MERSVVTEVYSRYRSSLGLGGQDAFKVRIFTKWSRQMRDIPSSGNVIGKDIAMWNALISVENYTEVSSSET